VVVVVRIGNDNAARPVEPAELVKAQLSPSPSDFLTVEEAASLLRCRRQRVYDLLSARRLSRYREGSRVLIKFCGFLAQVKGKTISEDTGDRRLRVAAVVSRLRLPTPNHP
jgi:excisionase family DNA binding protein